MDGLIFYGVLCFITGLVSGSIIAYKALEPLQYIITMASCSGKCFNKIEYRYLPCAKCDEYRDTKQFMSNEDFERFRDHAIKNLDAIIKDEKEKK